MPVVCNGIEATFLTRAMDIIMADGRTVSPTEYERLAGKGSSKKWKVSRGHPHAIDRDAREHQNAPVHASVRCRVTITHVWTFTHGILSLAGESMGRAPHMPAHPQGVGDPESVSLQGSVQSPTIQASTMHAAFCHGSGISHTSGTVCSASIGAAHACGCDTGHSTLERSIRHQKSATPVLASSAPVAGTLASQPLLLL